MFLYGQRSVIERLRNNPQSVRKVYLLEDIKHPEIADIARRRHIALEKLTLHKFSQTTRNVHAQGVMAEVDAFKYQDFDELIGDENKPTLVLLDRVTDPQNLGSIMRICACSGGFAVVLPKYESVEVSDTVLKVSCGAENHVPVSIVVNLSNAVQKAKDAGYWIGAAVVEGGENPRKVVFNFPLGLIFGSEGEGVRQGLLKHADYRLTLPMSGAQLSFNVATAVSIFCYEVLNQKNA